MKIFNVVIAGDSKQYSLSTDNSPINDLSDYSGGVFSIDITAEQYNEIKLSSTLNITLTLMSGVILNLKKTFDSENTIVFSGGTFLNNLLAFFVCKVTENNITLVYGSQQP